MDKIVMTAKLVNSNGEEIKLNNDQMIDISSLTIDPDEPGILSSNLPISSGEIEIKNKLDKIIKQLEHQDKWLEGIEKKLEDLETAIYNLDI